MTFPIPTLIHPNHTTKTQLTLTLLKALKHTQTFYPYSSSWSQSQSPPPPPREYYIPTQSTPELPNIYLQSTIATNKRNVATPTITYNRTINILPIDDDPFNPNITNSDSDHQHIRNPNRSTPIPPSLIPSPTPPTLSSNAKPHLLKLLKGPKGFSSLDYTKQILCETCMVIIPTHQWELHVQGKQHHRKLRQQQHRSRDLRITKVCELCGWQPNEKDYNASYEKHFTLRKHLRMLC